MLSKSIISKKTILNLLICSLFTCLLMACKPATSPPIQAIDIQDISENTLSWRLDQGGLYESKVSVYQSDEKLASYTVGCDLSDATSFEYFNEHTEEGDAEQATVDIVQIKAHKKGVLIVRCVIGAHSQMVEVYDPFSTEEEAFYSRSGSYYAEWELRDHELWVKYDQRCSEEDETQCDDAFLQLEEQVQ